MDEKNTKTEDAQPCCVCGEKTKQRCGACEQHGFDLFFCSREHQKLIWPVHKRVCGKPSFRHPSLTFSEAAYMRRHAHEAVPLSQEGGQKKSFLEWSDHVRKREKADVWKMLEVLSDPDVLTKFKHADIEQDLLDIRRFSSLARCPTRGAAYDTSEPFEQLALFSHELHSSLNDLNFSTPWRSILLHKTLIFLTLNKQYHETSMASPTSSLLAGYVATAGASLAGVVREEVLPVSGSAAAEKVREAISHAFGVDLSAVGEKKHE
ncbi:hypothetical protein JCM6882_007522 [Rhodosporidiobolus microsporus]